MWQTSWNHAFRSHSILWACIHFAAAVGLQLIGSEANAPSLSFTTVGCKTWLQARFQGLANWKGAAAVILQLGRVRMSDPTVASGDELIFQKFQLDQTTGWIRAWFAVLKKQALKMRGVWLVCSIPSCTVVWTSYDMFDSKAILCLCSEVGNNSIQVWDSSKFRSFVLLF